MNLQALVDQLTFEEKASLLTGSASMLTCGVPRLGIAPRLLSDGPHGVRMHEATDAVHFPNLCCAGASWDEEAMTLYGQALAQDCLKYGVSMILGPGINLKRNSLCGRNFEYLSEDPFLSGKLAAAYIRGVQEGGVAVSLKHYAANNQEMNRLHLNVDVDERTLRELYLRSFEIAVKESQPESIMCAYNKINAVWCSEHKQLLTDILRHEWGFKGLVVSDWGAVQSVVRSVRAGLDLIMPRTQGVAQALRNGLEKGAVTMEAIDQAAARVLSFLTKPRPGAPQAYDREAQHDAARRIAESGIVLMKNRDETLPLTKEKYRKIAVVGGYAKDPLICGQGAAEVYTDPQYVDCPLDELRKRLPECRIAYWEGFNKRSFSPAMLWPTMGAYRDFIADCDAVVVFMGTMESEDTENFDRLTARLHPNFSLYVENALKANKRLVVVLQTGSSVILPAWHKQIDALVQMGLAGEAAGSAIADVLTGLVNPSGKLSETYPNCERCGLSASDELRILEYKERLAVGYRYYDQHPEQIAYPFGHGLSYTRFAYGDMTLCRHEDAYTVSLTIENTGSVDGSEVVQLYAHDPVSTVPKPEKALIAFQKVFIPAGASATVTLRFPLRSLAYYNIALHDWVTESGTYVLMAGSSSRDIRRQTVLVYEDDDPPYTLSANSEAMLG